MSNIGTSKSKSRTGLLAGKHFFIDPKVDKATSAKVKQKLIALGGKVDEFLDKGIHFALTSAAIVGTSSKEPHCGALKKVLKGCVKLIILAFDAALKPYFVKLNGRRHRLSPYSPFGTTSSTADQNSSMGHRWKRLAKQASTKVQSSGIVDTAKSFGIKIRLIDDVLSWLNKKTEHMNINAAGQIVPPQQPNDIKLKDPCLKVEDFACALKPIYEEFESFSQLDLSVRGTKCPMVSHHSPTRTKPNAKKNQEKKGFCECCQCSYLNERKHRKTTEHLNFGETGSHFKKLDEYVSTQNLNLEKFLNRFKSKNDEVRLEIESEKDVSNQQEVKSFDMDLEESLTHSSLKSPEVTSAGEKPKTLDSTLRRSPRKCVRTDSPTVTNLKQCRTPQRNESKRRVLNSRDQNKNENDPSPDNQARLLPQPGKNAALNPASVKESKNPSTSIPPNAKSLDCSETPAVTLHELRCCSSRRRIRSYDVPSPGTSLLAELSDSPLFRLRSFKRKIHELDCVSPKSKKTFSGTKSHQLIDKSQTFSDELIFSFRSSTGDVVTENEFLGF